MRQTVNWLALTGFATLFLGAGCSPESTNSQTANPAPAPSVDRNSLAGPVWLCREVGGEHDEFRMVLSASPESGFKILSTPSHGFLSISQGTYELTGNLVKLQTARFASQIDEMDPVTRKMFLDDAHQGKGELFFFENHTYYDASPEKRIDSSIAIESFNPQRMQVRKSAQVHATGDNLRSQAFLCDRLQQTKTEANSTNAAVAGDARGSRMPIVERLKGKYPLAFLEDPEIAPAIKQALESAYSTLENNLTVGSEIKLESGWLIGNAFAPHMPSEAAAIAYQPTTKHLFIGLQSKGQLQVFGSKPTTDEAPASFREWLQQHKE